MPANNLNTIYRALVMNVSDPEAIKRIQVVVPQILGTAVSGWAWPAIPGGSVPALGDLVYIMFENGDPNNPVYLPSTAGGSAPDLTPYMTKANNLSDVVSVSTARSSLGLGTAATQSSGTFLQVANNLSDVTAATARTNLGLKSAAIENRAFWKPGDNNLLGAPYDPTTSTSSATFTAGTPSLCLVTLPDGGTIANVLYTITTAGATLTSGQNFVGVYSTAGVLLGLSADQSTNFAGSFVNRTAALTVQGGQSLTIAAGGKVYIAVLFNGTTSPTFQRAGTQNITNNIGLSAPNLRFCASATGGQTTMPGTITMSSTTATSGYFAALS